MNLNSPIFILIGVVAFIAIGIMAYSEFTTAETWLTNTPTIIISAMSLLALFLFTGGILIYYVRSMSK